MSDKTPVEPLWSDERIEERLAQIVAIEERGAPYVNENDTIDLFQQLRDDYEAELAKVRAHITTLEAELTVLSRELANTDNADRYYRGFNAGYDHADALAKERIAEIATLLDELEAAIDETHELLQSGGYVAFTPLTELLAKWRKRTTQ